MNAKQPLVVYFPGWSSFPPPRYNPLLKRLQKDSFNIVHINYRLFGTSHEIGSYARYAAKQLEPIMARYSHVIFIGHSMGGIVARKTQEYLSQLPDATVTIASPHRGTQAALLGFWSYSARQLRLGSKILKTLQPPENPTLAITGGLDFIVPDGSLDGATNIKIPYGEHTAMLGSGRVYGEIYSFLMYEILDELDLGDEPGTLMVYGSEFFI